MHFSKAIKLAATTAVIGATAPVSRNPERGSRPVVKGTELPQFRNQMFDGWPQPQSGHVALDRRSALYDTFIITLYGALCPMIFYPEERIAIFIDGANLYSAARGLAFDIDYRRLLDLFSTKGRLIRAFYYTALVEDQEYSPIGRS